MQAEDQLAEVLVRSDQGCASLGGESKDALFAYLHTDLLFNSDPSTHAEALAHLGPLWEKAGKPDYARDALSRLKRRYAATAQARSVGEK